MFGGKKYIYYLCIKIKRASNALVRRLTPTATACHRLTGANVRKKRSSNKKNWWQQ